MPFKIIILGTLGYVFEYRRILVRALFVPFALYMTLDAINLYQPDAVASFLLGILSLMVQTIFAITTHRVMLLGPQSIPSWGVLGWSRRETLFALHMIGLSLILMPLAFLVYIPVVGWAIATVLVIWIFGRLSLVFPTIAIDRAVSFRDSWQLTRRHQALMIFVVIVFPFVLMIPVYLLRLLPYSFVLTSFFTTLATVFTVTALSVAYKYISKLPADTPV